MIEPAASRGISFPLRRPSTSGRSPISSLLNEMVRSGRLDIVDMAGQVQSFGSGDNGPHVTVRFNDRLLPLKLLLNPSLALGEAYMDGRLTIEQGSLREFLHLLTQDLDVLDNRLVQRLRAWLGRKLPVRNHRKRSRANVSHHYDLSGALYDLFLDADRQYSCAYFDDGCETLEEAQAAKKRHIAAKLLLQPGCKVLDIGSGWGGLALEFAGCSGAEVHGISLSAEQVEAARARARAAGLDRSVRFELSDYRDLEDRYDRIVSIGMLEHVGSKSLDTYFQCLAGALEDDGVGLIHSIGRMEPPGGADPWINRYIFPGGYIPAMSEVLAAAERSGLWVTDVEVLRLHYAETLRHWFERFQARRAEAIQLYGERFCRMWEFYLAACEMLFRNGRLMVFQIQLAHRRDAVPLCRDYIYEFEHRSHEQNELAVRQSA